ncbi:MAG: glycosyltransferase family 39 protein, partial [Anaerolineae bacterium]
MSERVARRLSGAILLLFIGLGAAYALTTPTLEAPDEIYHYDYIRSLVKTGRPPVLEEGGGRGFGHHAPLYYAYGALVSFWVGENDLQAWPERHNPFFGYRFGQVGRDNKNLYLHPDDDAFGKSDTWLGVRVVRLASTVLGAITVWAAYRVGREVFPDQPEMAVGAAGLSAFVPEFLFISGAINDDNGAALFGALALWAMMRILRKGATWRRGLALGLALGMGWLSKLTIVALLPTAGLTLALVAWRDRRWSELFRIGLITFAVAALFIGPWVTRQTVLYRDPTGTSREMSEWGLRERPVTLADVGPDLYWLRTSFWGRLGYNQIPLSDWIYQTLDVITLLAVLGLMRLVLVNLPLSSRSVRARVLNLLTAVRGSQFIVLTAALVLTFGPMVVRRFLRPMPSFGRYLFPTLPSIALLMFAGLSCWLPRRYHSHLAVGVSSAMLALGIAALLCFLTPAYARPPVYAAEAAPEPTHRLNWTYLEEGDPLARLLGYDLDLEVIRPDETVRVTLYWKALRETDTNYVLFAQLFGREGAKVGQRDTYPGLGHYPTSFWRGEQVIVDQVTISLEPEAMAPSRIRLDIGLYERGGGRLRVVNKTGQAINRPTAGWLKLAPPEEVIPPSQAADYRLGQAVSLNGFDLHKAS